MILVMTRDEANRQIAQILTKDYQQDVQYYPQCDLRTNIDSKLTIIDINADGKFQFLYLPELLAKFLVHNGLSSAVKRIELLVSDVDPEKSLLEYAFNLSYILGNYHNLSVSVSVITNINYDYTIVHYSHEKNQWEIFGLKNVNIPINQLNGISSFLKSSNKIILWTGKNIHEWLDNPQRTLFPHVFNTNSG